MFYAPSQVLYKCVTAHQLNPGYEYLLTIKNKKTGKIITAKTNLIDEFSITKPDANAPLFDFSRTGAKAVVWNTAKNGRRYQAKIIFNYTETDALNNSVNKYVEWLLPYVKSNELTGGVTMSSSFYGSQFYQTLKSNIPVDPTVTRKAGKVEFIITVVGDELSTYLDVNAP